MDIRHRKKLPANRTLLLSSLLTGCMLLGATSAWAADQQETLPEFTFDQVIVTAQRRETKDLETPASTTVITAEQIKETGAQTIYDALDYTIGFSNMSYGPGGMDYGASNSRNTIRGLDKGTLVLLNGAPLNLLNYNGTDGIPVEAIERIEIIKGASSTLYGSEALAGVVNIITKKPGDSIHKNTVEMSAGNYYGSFSISSQFDSSALYVQREWFDAVDRTSRKGIDSSYWWGRASSHKNSLFYTAALSDKLTFSSSLMRNEPKRPRYRDSNDRLATIYAYDDRRYNFNLTYDDEEQGLRSVIAYNYRRLAGLTYTYTDADNPIVTRSKGTTYNMYSITSDTQKTQRLRSDKDTLITGFTYGREHFDDPSTENAAVYKNAFRNTFSLYSSYDHAFSTDFNATLGLRAQHVGDYAASDNVLLPQIQTLYKLNDTAVWYINIGKAYQMPPLNQYFTYTGQNAYRSLKPQQGWTYETGIKIIQPKQSWKMSVYHMDIRDKFSWKKDANNENYLTNAGDFRNTGAEVEYARILNNNWRFNVGFSVSNPEINDTGEWVQDSSRIQAVAGLTYNNKKFKGNINYLYVGDREDSYYTVNGDVSAVPSRSHLNAKLGYTFDNNNTLNCSFYNILNRDNSINKYENLDLPFNWVMSYTHSF